MSTSVARALHATALRCRLLACNRTDEVFRVLRELAVPRLADDLAVVRTEPGRRDDPAGVEAPRDASGASESETSAWIAESPAADAWRRHDLTDPEMPDGARWAAFELSRFPNGPVAVVHRATGSAFDANVLASLWELTRFAAIALDHLRTSTRADRERAESASSAFQSTKLARLARGLVGALRDAQVCDGLLAATVPYLADWALVHLRDARGRLRLAQGRHADPDRQALVTELVSFPLGRSYTGDHAACSPVPSRLPHGSLARGELAARSTAGEHATVAALDAKFVVSFPFFVESELAGVLTCVRAESDQMFTADDLRLLRAAADMASNAFASAAAYRLAERSRLAREEMLSIVSHDLRNPLNVVALASAVLSQDGVRGEQARHQLHLLRHSITQMEELIQDLLTCAKMDAGRFVVRTTAVDSRMLVQEALERLQPLADDAGVRLLAEASSWPKVRAERKRLHQVLANLIGNAISFTPRGGTVTVLVSADGDQARFRVRDSGIGIDAETLPHVFDRFWQARRTGRAGAGLGLAIAKGIVEAHEGTISVFSEPSRGAEFTFTVPLADQLLLQLERSESSP